MNLLFLVKGEATTGVGAVGTSGIDRTGFLNRHVGRSLDSERTSGRLNTWPDHEMAWGNSWAFKYSVHRNRERSRTRRSPAHRQGEHVKVMADCLGHANPVVTSLVWGGGRAWASVARMCLSTVKLAHKFRKH